MRRQAVLDRLSSIRTAEEGFRLRGIVDANDDGAPEFAFLPELAGAVLRPRSTFALDELGSDRWPSRASARGGYALSGYWFVVFLPDANGLGVDASAAGSVSAANAAKAWCCYAWSELSGEPTFFVERRGCFPTTTDRRYCGPDGCPDAGAAFADGAGILGWPAYDRLGRDGNKWVPLDVR